MGLPWIQVDVGFSKSLSAQELAAELGLHRREAVGLMVDLWTWCTENAPAGQVVSRHAARIIEQAAGWDGASGAFFEAAERVGLLRCDEDTVTIAGWEERYGSALAKQAADAERKRLARAQLKAVRGASGGRPADGTPDIPEPVRVTAPGKMVDGRLETEDVETAAAAVRARARGSSSSSSPRHGPVEKTAEAVDLSGVPLEELPDTPDGFWEFAQRERASVRQLPRETSPPKGLADWHARAHAEGFGARELSLAFTRYLSDDDFAPKGWPVAVFLSPNVWKTRVHEHATRPRYA